MEQRMVRKQVYITRDQEERLKRLAKERSTSEAELLREGLERFLEAEARAERARGAWAEEERFIQQLIAKARKEGASDQGSGAGRGWTREEIYEERLNRYGR